MNVLVLHSSLSSAYLINEDGSSKKPARINGAYDNFAVDSAFAMIKGRLYIFGGYWINDPDEPDNQKKVDLQIRIVFRLFCKRLDTSKDANLKKSPKNLIFLFSTDQLHFLCLMENQVLIFQCLI